MNKDNIIKTAVVGAIAATYLSVYAYTNSVAKEKALEGIEQALIKEGTLKEKGVKELLKNNVSFDAGVSLSFSPYVSNLNVSDIITADSLVLNNIDNESKKFNIVFENLIIDTSGVSWNSPPNKKAVKNILSRNNIPDVAGLGGFIDTEEGSTVARVEDINGSRLDFTAEFNAITSSNFSEGGVVVLYDSNGHYELINKLPLNSIPYEFRDNIKTIGGINVDEIYISVEPNDDEAAFKIEIEGDNLEFKLDGVIPNKSSEFEDDLELDAYINYSENPQVTSHLMEQIPYEMRSIAGLFNPQAVELTLKVDGGEAEWEFEASTSKLLFESSGKASNEDLDFSATIENSSGKAVYTELGLNQLISIQVKNYKKILEDDQALEVFESSSEAHLIVLIGNDSDVDDALDEVVDFLEDPKSIKVTVDGETKDFISATRGLSPNVEKLQELLNITLN